MPDDPDMLVPLMGVRTEFEAAAMAESLKAEGIPAEVFATSGATLQWNVAWTDPIKLMVRRKDVERARAALKRVRSDSVDIDWADVDVGSPEPGSVPAPARLHVRGQSPRQRAVRTLGWTLLFISMLLVMFQPTRLPGLIAMVVIGALWARAMFIPSKGSTRGAPPPATP